MKKLREKSTMTKAAVFTALVAMVLFVSGAAMAGDLEPSAPPASTMKTLDEVEPRIPISSVPYTINQSGSYYLTGNLTSATSGITIQADDVTIDLMGYSLIGPGGSGSDDGIVASSRSNIEIRNGTVTNFPEYGIDLLSGKYNRIINMRATFNDANGLWISGPGSLVKDSTFSDNNNDGMHAGNGCTVTGNTAYNNTDDGFEITYGITVTGNTAFSNDGDGIIANSGCTIVGNTTYFNGESGIDPTASCLIDQNTAYNNTLANIDVCATCTFGLNHAP